MILLKSWTSYKNLQKEHCAILNVQRISLLSLPSDVSSMDLCTCFEVKRKQFKVRVNKSAFWVLSSELFISGWSFVSKQWIIIFKSSKNLSLNFMTLSFMIQNLKKNQQHAILFVYIMFQTCNQEITASYICCLLW